MAVHPHESRKEADPRAADVQALYETMTATYDDVEGDGFYHNQYATYGRWLDSTKGEFRERTVLDLGAGTGLMTLWLSNVARKVVGVDISRGLLDVARRRCHGRTNVELVEADATRLPFESGSFDAINSFGETLSHMAHPERGVAEAARVLRRGGAFLFSVLNKWNLGLLHDRRELRDAVRAGRNGHVRTWECVDDRGAPTKFGLRTFAGAELESLLRQHGFRIERFGGIHVSSLAIPLRLQGKGKPLDKLYRALGRVDELVGDRGPLAGFGWSRIVLARRV